MTDPAHQSDDGSGAPDDGWALPRRDNEPYDAPGALDLIEAVRGYLSDELLPRTQGADRWLVRIAANALAIAAREVALGPTHRAAHRQWLDALGAADDPSLSALIRSGDLDERWAAVHEALTAIVDDKLDAASPAHREAD